MYGIAEREVSPRQVVEAAIERLVGLLDRMDPDPDLEPSLGGGCRGAPVDVEGDASDDEPSLGSLGQIDQTRWSHGALADQEATGLDEDDESLGSLGARSWSETRALRAVEAEVLALASRLGRRRPERRRPGLFDELTPLIRRTCE